MLQYRIHSHHWNNIKKLNKVTAATDIIYITLIRRTLNEKVFAFCSNDRNNVESIYSSVY